MSDHPPPPPPGALPPPPSPDAAIPSYPGDKWEYRVLTFGTNSRVALQRELNNLGAHGWEVVGFAAADRTLGLNSLEVLLKRKVLPGFQSGR